MYAHFDPMRPGTFRSRTCRDIRNPSKTFYVAPATKLEHPGTEIAIPIPEGMRFALDVIDAQIESWVATKPAAYQKLARIVARARYRGRPIWRWSKRYGGE